MIKAILISDHPFLSQVIEQLFCNSCLHQYSLNDKFELQYWNWQVKDNNFVGNRIEYVPSLAFAVNDDKSIGFVGQTFDNTSQVFERNFTYIGLTIEFDIRNSKMYEPKRLHLDWNIRHQGKIKDQLERLETINNKIEIIGIFMNLNNETTVFVRFNDTIKYCSVAEVNTFSQKLLEIHYFYGYFIENLVFESKLHSFD